MNLVPLLKDKKVLVCCGAGGVGKTTVAAALGVGSAILGLRACVVTVDPARRLGDALGISGSLRSPSSIEGPWTGELFAVMLDAHHTFDELVNRYATSEKQRESILTNSIYASLVTTLSGTQEYMATEKLYELYEEGGFDIIIVDTPPSAHALEFLEASSRLRGFLDNRILRILLMPGRTYLRAVSVATRLFVRTLSRVAGTEVVDDTIAFFQAFEGMEQGFRERAASVESLLRSEATGYVLVGVPRRDIGSELEKFAEKLASTWHGPDALVVNRTLLEFDTEEGAGLRARAQSSEWGELVSNLADLSEMASKEKHFIDELAASVGAPRVVALPRLDGDVHDVAGLEVVARQLLADGLPFGRGADPARQ